MGEYVIKILNQLGNRAGPGSECAADGHCGVPASRIKDLEFTDLKSETR
jgi:hypothetical protein